MKRTVTIDYDKRKRMGLLSGDHFDDIREHFSVHNDAAKYARFKGRFIPSRRYVITPQGRFEPGLFHEIKKYARENFPDAKIYITDSLREVVSPSMGDVYRAPRPALSLELRDYQQDIVSVCLKHGRGVTVLATAGGKTLTIASLIESIHKQTPTLKCLIVVPDLGLVNQTFNDFTEYGVTFMYSKWTGNNDLNIGSNVIIANMGILQSDKSDVSWIQDIDMLIIDEVHKLRKDNKINKLISSIRTSHKFGFTGTMPEQQLDQWNVIGRIGRILYERNSYQLREQDYVANVKVQVLKIEYNTKPESFPNDMYDPTAKFRREQEFISKNSFRNEILSKIGSNFEKNSLIMVDRIEHGEELFGVLSARCKGKQIFFIRGDVPVEERDKVKSIMEAGDNVICIAISKIFSTGISIKNLHYIVFAGGGKAKVKIIQSIGRGLRLHKNKTGVIIIDIADTLHYSLKHYAKRLELYKGEKINYAIKKISQGKEATLR